MKSTIDKFTAIILIGYALVTVISLYQEGQVNAACVVALLAILCVAQALQLRSAREHISIMQRFFDTEKK